MEIFRSHYRKMAVIVMIMLISGAAGYLLYLKYGTAMKTPSPVIKPTNDPSRMLPDKKTYPQVKMAERKPEPIFHRITEPINLLPRQLDFEKIQETTENLTSGTVDQQIASIIILSKIGDQQQKEIIKGFALNPDKEIAIRLAAVETMDWEQDSETIGGLILSQNEIAEPLIYMASEKELSEEKRNIFDNAVYEVFFQDSLQPSTQLAILNYFLERQSGHFDEIISQVNSVGYSPQEIEDLKNLWGAANSNQNS